MLQSATGDFTAAIDQCIDNDRQSASVRVAETPAEGNAFLFLVRPVNCGDSVSPRPGNALVLDASTTGHVLAAV